MQTKANITINIIYSVTKLQQKKDLYQGLFLNIKNIRNIIRQNYINSKIGLIKGVKYTTIDVITGCFRIDAKGIILWKKGRR